MQRLIKRKPRPTAEEVAEQFIIKYFQEWDQTSVMRAYALAELCRYCGMKVDVVDLGAGVEIRSKTDIPEGLLKELGKCWPKGRLEREVEAVVKVIEKYKKKSILRRLYERINKGRISKKA